MIELAGRVQKLVPKFYLAGGTAIMFKHRHRVGDDLDFFSREEFSMRRVALKFRKAFKGEREFTGADNLDLFIDQTKAHIASDYDLFLNKVYVAGPRVDRKDPVDGACLCGMYRWPFSRIKQDFETKFPGQGAEVFLGALFSFDDYGGLPAETKQHLTELREQIT